MVCMLCYFVAIFVDEKDMSTLAIQAVEDPRTLDKILYVRPPANICSFGQLVCLWEKKIGKTIEKHYISEQELVKKIEGIWTHLYIPTSLSLSQHQVYTFSILAGVMC